MMGAFRRAALLALAVAAGTIGVQAATGAGAITVRGNQWLPATAPAGSATCTEDEGALGFEILEGFTYVMTGDLVGCWYTLEFNETHVKGNAGGSYKANGRERFVGCVDTVRDGQCIDEGTSTFDTTFTFTAKFAGAVEVHGRCHHPVVSGTGAFSGIRGVLSFKDYPSEGRFPYHGNLQF